MFIEEYPGAVNTELCEQIIARFEADPRRAPSTANINGQPTVHTLRTGTHLVCDTTGDWGEIVKAIVPALQSTLALYAQKHTALKSVIETEGLDCTGPVIERVDPGQGFAWHYDQTSHSRQRVLAGLLYLQTIKEGGHTEFKEQGHTIRPETGKIALFPPYWTHMHRGVSPTSETKYVISFFWIYGKDAPKS
tara:strand:+ start:813 stop:1388 length:576 start_codon:yes stop_codon:yes gene_type:complete